MLPIVHATINKRVKGDTYKGEQHSVGTTTTPAGAPGACSPILDQNYLKKIQMKIKYFEI